MNGVPASPRHEAVVLYRSDEYLPDHEAVVHRDIAMRIADLMDVPFDGDYEPARHHGKPCYIVPSRTLVGPEVREQLSVEDETDFFGGYVTHGFMATKAITHQLVNAQARRPSAWSDDFGRQVKTAALPGYTAFSTADLREAAVRLLAEGSEIRLKPVLGTAGRGQQRIRSIKELEYALAKQDIAQLAEYGIVLETQLDDVATYSVGQVRLPGLTASYVGTQCLTRDNQGEEVYGGSQLRFTRGGYADLLQLPLDEDFRQAVALAACYDNAASTYYPGLMASRRNYDIATGLDGSGRRQAGVLEQSWRIGGASRAEIAALEVFSADAGCKTLWAETLELFGPDAVAPSHAIETYSGHDPDLGLIRKYVMVEAYGNKQ